MTVSDVLILLVIMTSENWNPTYYTRCCDATGVLNVTYMYMFFFISTSAGVGHSFSLWVLQKGGFLTEKGTHSNHKKFSRPITVTGDVEDFRENKYSSCFKPGHSVMQLPSVANYLVGW